MRSALRSHARPMPQFLRLNSWLLWIVNGGGGCTGTGVHLQVLCDDQELGHTEQLLGARPATPVFKEEVKIPIVFEEPQDLVVKVRLSHACRWQRRHAVNTGDGQVVQSDTGAVIGECSTSVGKMLRVKGRVRGGPCFGYRYTFPTPPPLPPLPRYGLQAEIALRRPRLTSGDLGSAVGVVGVSSWRCLMDVACLSTSHLPTSTIACAGVCSSGHQRSQRVPRRR